MSRTVDVAACSFSLRAPAAASPGDGAVQYGHRFLQPALARQSQGLHHVDIGTNHIHLLRHSVKR